MIFKCTEGRGGGEGRRRLTTPQVVLTLMQDGRCTDTSFTARNDLHDDHSFGRLHYSLAMITTRTTFPL